MPSISMEIVVGGDILAADVIVNEVVLFEAGTVLTPQRIEILRALNIARITVEDRSTRKKWTEDTLKNLDARFSYVEEIPLMLHMKTWIRDVLLNLEGSHGRKSD